MCVYRIAELNILVNSLYKNTEILLAPYKTEISDYDFDATVTDDEVKKKYADYNGIFKEWQVESSLVLFKICNTILEKYSGFFFHSSSLMLDGEGYVFSAASGTGKSTHTALWQKHFGSRVQMINDDKPVIRKTDDKFYIYGTPWMGKSEIGSNIKAPVKAVFLLRRADENSVVRVKTGEVFPDILSATVVPQDKAKMTELLKLLDEFFTSVPLYVLNCNISDDAVVTAYNAANNFMAKDND